MTEIQGLDMQYDPMSVRSKKVYDANLILCPRTVEELRKLIDSVVDYDCFLVNRDQAFDGSHSALILEIAARKSDWIEVFGYHAEEIHDAIDRASVESKRQAAVGSGIPMTSWNDYESTQDVVDYIRTGGHGVSDTKLLIFIGNEEEERMFWKTLDRREPKGQA
jgi:hypothetical protein